MKVRTVVMFVLAVGLGLVSVLVVVAWSAENHVPIPETSSAADVAPAIDFATWQGEVNLGYANQIGFTPVATIYLPIVLRNYCSSPIFSDDFSDPGSGWPSWSGDYTGGGYVGGEYQIYANPGYWGAARADYYASDYVVATDGRLYGGDGIYGLIFGLSDDWTELYAFQVDTLYSMCGIDRYGPSGWDNLAFTATSSINLYGATNRLAVRRSGATIEAYVNGDLVLTVTDGTYVGSRRVGLIVTGISQNTTARFDNFAVYDLSCGPGAAGLSAACDAPVYATGVELNGWAGGRAGGWAIDDR